MMPVYYYSKQATPSESNYDSYTLEALAIARAVEKFRVYLLGIPFKIITDCQAFEKTLKKSIIPRNVREWAMMLQEFEYTIEHRAGTRMRHVDALSRAPVLIVEDKLLSVIKARQTDDDQCKAIVTILEKAPHDDLVFEGGLLKKFVNGKLVLFVPETMRRELIRTIHGNGHFGTTKVMDILNHDYYIPRAADLAKEVISCCVPCILSSHKRGKKEGELNPIPKGDVPLATYHIDHVGPMNETSKLYKYLLVVVDGFSKFTWIYPTKTTNTTEVLERMRMQQITFGNPDRIVADRGAAFTSNEFKKFCDDEKISLTHITTGVPRGNGQVERMHQVIVSLLTKMSVESPENWYKNVGQVQRCINSTFQRSIKMSPFELLVGTKMKQATDVAIMEMLEQELAEVYCDTREELRIQAKTAILAAQEEQKRQYGKKSKVARRYMVGDIVAIKKTQFETAAKIKPKFIGPYRIVRVGCNDRYDVERLDAGEGPRKTSTCADHMKVWANNGASIASASGTDAVQDGRVVGDGTVR